MAVRKGEWGLKISKTSKPSEKMVKKAKRWRPRRPFRALLAKWVEGHLQFHSTQLGDLPAFN